MTKEASRQVDATVVVIIHRAGDAWHAVAASTRSNPPSILDSRTFGTDDAAQIGDWIERHKAAEVIRVLPAGSVICRNFPLPAADPSQLEEALHLQAEAHLAGVAPDYRIGQAVLHEYPGETSRTGIVVAWPESAVIEPIKTSAPVHFVPDVAALAGLLDGERPADPLLWVDRHNGSLSMAITHSGGAVFRATREDGDDDTPWAESVGRIVAETALGAGHTAGFVESIVTRTREQLSTVEPGGSRLVLPADVAAAVRRRVQDADAESTWWNRYGVAVGALLARTSHLEPLTRLVDEPPRDDPSIVRSALERLSSPSTAVKVAILCLLVLTFGPLASNAARLQILKLKHGRIDEQMRAVSRARQVRAMYIELGEQSWTMTKLLADLANSTPLGIELDQIRITHGDALNIEGTAVAYDGKSPPEVIAEMTQRLYDAGFADVRQRRNEANNLGGYEFDLSAKITSPHRPVSFDEESDFAVVSYRERLYGPPPEDLDETALASGGEAAAAPEVELMNAARAAARSDEADDDLADERTGTDRVASVPSTRRRGSSGAPNDGAKSIGAGDTTGAGRSRLDDIPPELSDEQIAAMTKSEALQSLAKVSTARKYAATIGDTALEARLKSDFERLMERVKKQ